MEVNPIIARTVMQQRFRAFNGDLYNRPEVHLVVNDGRSFVRGSAERYDSIQATLVDTWAATAAGAFTLSENNLYTREAFADYLTHLTDDGLLTMTRWRNDPPREFLRLLVLGRSALTKLGVTQDHARHFYVASDARMATFLLKRTPFSPEEVASLDAYVEAAGLTRLFSPLADDDNAYAHFLRTADWRQFVARHPDDISPPSDDRPFFFYTVRPERLLAAAARFSQLSRDNLGLVLLLLSLAVVGVLVLAFLVLPLFLLRRDVLAGERGVKLRFLSYFIAIGIGFITVEIALMQRFVLLLGRPVLALVVILFALLVTSGAGSYLSRRTRAARLPRVIARNTLVLAGLLVAALCGLTPLFALLAGAPLAVRVAVAVALIAPLGLCMGSFLPLGVAGAGERLAPLVPWAWGINGAASVLGSVLAMVLAMNAGFDLTLGAGLLCYGAAALSARLFSRTTAQAEGVAAEQAA